MSEKKPSKAVIYKPPTRTPITTPSVILYGSIEPSTPSSPDWQTHLSTSLSDLPITIINPVCEAWDSTWVEDISDVRFKEQAEWEMDHAKVADVIAFYFKPGTLTPVSLLELGMYAAMYEGMGKVAVCAPQGFYKRGNVQIVCGRFGVELVGTLEELEKAVRVRLLGKLAA
ncbi:hypothetical protein BU25DRAFT_388940 [Macroventuria anomochaeta]|uniref:Uncharacterized protein n=1 Tax=Macroventuria anomochaeta TaxID=301207 RepID=A0ACB6S8N3_9PLEO|nr:uncharacterized protein BU25DRAFT_388940 [Macroventuria anomochaeta]KAF2629714.1 hypothetical protein BU25DRAFT_388940 [Macroventuria anomochaeta]